MWINDNAGIIVLIFGVLTLALLGVALWLVFGLRSRFAVQRLKFVGLYSADTLTRANYASLTIGNRSVNEIALKELGIKNGGVAFDLTALYKRKAGLDEKGRIVIEQRHSLDFCLDTQELRAVLIDGKKGKELKMLRLYAIDLTGNLYEGRIPAVRRLLAALLAEDRASGGRGGAPSEALPLAVRVMKAPPAAEEAASAPVEAALAAAPECAEDPVRSAEAPASEGFAAAPAEEEAVAEE